MINSIITEVGFILIGGIVAAIPIAIVGFFLNKENV